MQTNEDQAKLEDVMENVTAESMAQEVLQLAKEAEKLKVDFVNLRKAAREGRSDQKRLRDMTDRVIGIDVPNLISNLARQVAGSIIALDYFISEGEEDDDDYDEDLDEGALALLSIRDQVKDRIKKMMSLIEYMEQRDGAPQGVKDFVRELRDEANQMKQQLEEAEAVASGQKGRAEDTLPTIQDASDVDSPDVDSSDVDSPDVDSSATEGQTGQRTT